MRSPDVYCKIPVALYKLSSLAHKQLSFYLQITSMSFKVYFWKEKCLFDYTVLEDFVFCLNTNEHWLWGISFHIYRHLQFTYLLIVELTGPIKNNKLATWLMFCLKINPSRVFEASQCYTLVLLKMRSLINNQKLTHVTAYWLCGFHFFFHSLLLHYFKVGFTLLFLL